MRTGVFSANFFLLCQDSNVIFFYWEVFYHEYKQSRLMTWKKVLTVTIELTLILEKLTRLLRKYLTVTM